MRIMQVVVVTWLVIEHDIVRSQHVHDEYATSILNVAIKYAT